MLGMENNIIKGSGFKDMLNINKKNKKSNIVVEKFLGNKKDNKINQFLMPVKKNMKVLQPLQPLNFNLENVGWNRMQQQKNLSLFGDRDKDGVKNIFDCQPFNFRKQDRLSEVLEEYKPEDEIPVEVVDENEVEPVYSTEYEQEQVAEEPKKSKILEGLKNVGGRFVRGTKKVLTDAEVIGTPQSNLYYTPERELFERAKLRGRLDAIRAIEREQLKRGSFSKGRARRSFRELYTGLQLGSRQFTSPQIIQASIEPGIVQQGNKISNLIGLKRGGFYGERVIERGEPQPQMQQPQMQQSQPTRPQFDPEQKKFSPYSKRRVTYIRGPYSKSNIQRQEEMRY